LASCGLIPWGLVLAATLVACKFTPSGAVVDGKSDGASDGPSKDSLLPDGPSMCASSFTSCGSDGTTMFTCIEGAASTSTDCPWGCMGDGASSATCGAVAPTGGAVTGSDFDGAPSLSLGSTTINADNGMIMSGGLGGGSAWPYFHHVGVGNGVGIFSFDELTIAGSVTITGTSAVAFVASGAIDIGGVVDARAMTCIMMGNGVAPGPGGFAGTMSHSASSGGSGQGGNSTDDSASGGGGGDGGAGGSGGYGMNAGQAGSAGPVFGAAAVAILVGGGGGGAGPDPNGGNGGGGGGAVQFVSNARITIDVGGGIDVGGCGGGIAKGGHSGGGAGAGGAIVLEAPSVTIDGQLAANGGGGGGGDDVPAQPGAAGTLGATPAGGGSGKDGNHDEDGGAGGAGSVFAGSAGAHGGAHGGGGGGGVGWIRINSRLGSPTTMLGSGAVISPDPTAPSSPATIAAAQVLH
jgi:hypothetical protein